MWKQNTSITAAENNLLQQLQVHTLYVKYFDVVWKNEQNVPVAKVDIDSSVLQARTAIIPVVYITQEAIDKCPNIITLSKNIVQLVQSINQKKNIKVQEVQIDCDWTTTNQKKYFEFLQRLQEQFGTAVSITATIRLHQIKYADKTGVPPIKRGMLMFYNMGDMQQINSANTIYNKADALKYVKYCKEYPLHLDVALPVFSWAIHYRENKVVGLYARKNDLNYTVDSIFKKVDDTHFQVLKSYIHEGNYFLANDFIKIEKMDATMTNDAASLLSNYISLEERNIVFFDLDSTLFKTYNHEEYHKILEHFR